MKIANTTSPLIVSEGFDPNASIMGMSQEAALQMAKHLRDTIYTDKILAVVREFGVNSNDEHIKYGIDKNVEIGIREIDGQYEFFSRDFAKGLSEEGIRTVFGVYGNSTKTNTNKEAGCYGVGSKCGFCYTDSYYVVSYFNGEKTTYTCALGGDNKGSSNGFIYKTHVEPSNETGLEVIVPVKSDDVSKFSNEIRNFVFFSPHKIVCNILGIEFAPFPVVWKETHEGIDFILYDGFSGHRSDMGRVQMGGVQYEYINLPEGFRTKDNCTFVINVPIGSMTVALSRESFHDTLSNQNFKSKITSILEELTQKDFATLKAKPLKNFIDENLGELHINKQVEGAIFKTRIAYVYPETWKVIGNLAYIDCGTVVKKNDKPLLVLIPNNVATSYWKKKLSSFAKNNGQSYYIACQREFLKLSPEGNTEINNCFAPIGVKSIKFPRTPKTKSYAVYHKQSSYGKYNAIEFANLLRQDTFKMAEERDEQKLREWIAEEKKKAISTKKIDSLLKLAITISGPSKYIIWSCKSEELAQQLENLGLFVVGRGEFYKLTQKWHTEETQENQRQAKIKSALKGWVSFNSKTIDLAKKDKNAERMNKFWEVVMKEKSSRQKIFKHVSMSYENYYGNKEKLTRNEFRAIMRLERI